MKSRISRSLALLISAIAIGISAAVVHAQVVTDPDPNSPTPVLMNQPGTEVVLAANEAPVGRAVLPRTSPVFLPGATVTLFVKNIKLLPNEGSNAFRLDVSDSVGHRYRFPVVSIAKYSNHPSMKGVYAVTTVLRDEIGYWGAPSPGPLSIAITWRGLSSNRLTLNYIVAGDTTQARAATQSPTRRMAAPDSPEYVGYRWDGDRMRFLEQATFGPTAMVDARLRRIGLKTWLAEQFELPYPSAGSPYPDFPLKPANVQPDCNGDPLGDLVPDVPLTCFRDSYTMYQPQKWLFQEAFYGSSQLRHRVAWALAQIWVTSGLDVQQGQHMVEYHKILSGNAFGNYRDLMEQATLSPTMGTYLDMANSTRNNPNENYARELMQLFTIGLFLLNQDGTLKLDASNNPIPTYDQEGVNNLTKVLTGWTLCNGATCAHPPPVGTGTLNYTDPMIIVNTNNHDQTAKTLLTWPADPAFPAVGSSIAACGNCTNAANIRAYAAQSMETALDNIFNHPNVGPFVSKILIQHMVTSDPTPAYVGRVAAVFNNNGVGVRGDMKAVVKAILLDPEARGDVKTDPNFGKLREPVQLATNFLKAMNVRSADGSTVSDGVIFGRSEFTGMGQQPFRSPTVFNFYPPDYGIPGTTLLGPEFALMTTGTAIQRQNFVNRMVYGNPPIPGGTNDAPNGTSLDFSDLQALAAADTTGALLVDELDRRMLHSTMSAEMRAAILTAVTSLVSTNTMARAQMAVHLVATSSQFQIQR